MQTKMLGPGFAVEVTGIDPSRAASDAEAAELRALLVELDGNDHWFFAGDQQPVLEAVKRFVGTLPAGRRPPR